ncbi:MAG TPA: 4Fe-4S binding protein [Dissulfurispiraceae bacterium]|nr:4Fe-4S binding protein [Dissulfurispiraceae bacterium]
MKLKLLRRITQITVLAILVAMPILNLKGITVLIGSLYSLAIGPLWITDPMSGLQVILATLTVDGTLLLSMLLPVIFSFIFGRAFCGWMCPQNLLSEAADYLRSVFPIDRPLKLPPSAVPRYVVIAVMLCLTLLMGFPVANLISSPGIISVEISEYLMTGMVGAEVSIVGAILVVEFLIIRRAWCNFICPVGGLLGLFRMPKTLKVVYEKHSDQCIKCGACIKACQLGLNPMGAKIYPLCHNCGDCITACKRATGKINPLSFKF